MLSFRMLHTFYLVKFYVHGVTISQKQYNESSCTLNSDQDYRYAESISCSIVKNSSHLSAGGAVM